MKRLYKIPLPEAAQVHERDGRGSELAESGVLDESAQVEKVSSDTPDLQLRGQYRYGEWHSSMFATELEELANSSIGPLPLFRIDERYPEAGYYEIDSVEVEPAHPNARDVWEWELRLRRKGTRAKHYRAVESNPRQVDHGWGNDIVVQVAVPAASSKAQWFDAETGDREPATPLETRQAEFGDVDIYDLESGLGYEFGDGDAPLLIYEADYSDEAPTDVRVYDTRGEEKYLESEEVDGRVRLWETIFDTDHDTASDADLILDNGLLRLRFDEAAGTLEAETWNSTSGEWDSVALSQPSTVELFDVNIFEISMVSDRAQLTFDVDGSLFALDVTLQRGFEDALFSLPPNETGPIPTEIEDWLAPIAQTTIIDAAPSKGLVSRSEVSR